MHIFNIERGKYRNGVTLLFISETLSINNNNNINTVTKLSIEHQK